MSPPASLPASHLAADGGSVVAVGQLVRTHKADVLATVLEGFDADVLEDVFDPHARPHGVGHSRRPPRKPVVACVCAMAETYFK